MHVLRLASNRRPVLVPQSAAPSWFCSYDHLAFLCLCYKVLLLEEQGFANPNLALPQS